MAMCDRIVLAHELDDNPLARQGLGKEYWPRGIVDEWSDVFEIDRLSIIVRECTKTRKESICRSLDWKVFVVLFEYWDAPPEREKKSRHILQPRGTLWVDTDVDVIG